DTADVAIAEVLVLAAGLERHSEHGLGRAVVNAAAERGIGPILARNVRAVPGRGIVGHIDAGTVAAGNLALMRDLSLPVAPGLEKCARRAEASGHSVIYVGWGQRTHAVISLDDTPIPDG